LILVFNFFEVQEINSIVKETSLVKPISNCFDKSGFADSFVSIHFEYLQPIVSKNGVHEEIELFLLAEEWPAVHQKIGLT
jgi:hypothetical protein